VKRLLSLLLAVAVCGCSPAGKGKPTGTAASGEKAPPIVALSAPTADADIEWEEWAPAGWASSKLDWPAGAASVGGRLYLAGTRKAKPPAGRDRITFAEIVFLEVTPAGFREIAAYPSELGECARAAVTSSPDGQVWFIGGAFTPPPIEAVPEGELEYAELGTPEGNVYRWNRGDGKLVKETLLPIPRSEAAAFFDQGELYVVGGVFDAVDPACDNNKQVHRYNRNDGLWTKLHDLKVPLAAPAAAVARDGLYVIGGRQLKPVFPTNAVYRYDLTVFKWQRRPPMPSPRVAASAYVVGDYIYVVGGREAEGMGTPGRLALKTLRYDVKKQLWEILPSPLPEGSVFTAYDGADFYLIGNAKTYRGRLVKAARPGA